MQVTRIEMLSIGDELLDGRVADTNTLRLAERLNEVGARILQRTSITDDISVIISTLHEIMARGTTLCVVSGGLGPTADDLTAAAFAQLLNVKIVRDAEQIERITQSVQRRGRTMLPNHLKQAEYPEGTEVIHNNVGHAVGFIAKIKQCAFYVLPGVPKEFDAMVDEALLQPLKRDRKPYQKAALYSFGLAEAEVDKRLKDMAEKFPEVRLGFRVKFPEIHVTLRAEPDQENLLQEAFAYAEKQLAPHVFSTKTTENFAQSIIGLLQSQKATIGIAESCTGGLVGNLLTDISGVGDVFMVDVVAYSDTIKSQVLGVPKELLEAHGAVSEQVVLSMAQNIRDLACTTFGLATSGIAGPTGGTAEKPVGTLWVAVVGPKTHKTLKLTSSFDRLGNKMLTAYAVLELLRQMLRADER